ncbi:MAG: alkaline phosphatase family protein [Gammaproteobacteria bacterium]|nr:alkaline phosphatase family protein [Gammaproteobacteria bacterium]
MITRSFILSVMTFLLSATHGQASELLSGPMVGHTTTDSARIWLETDQPSEVRILYWQEPRIQYKKSLEEPIKRGVAKGTTNKAAPHVGVVELEGLNPGWLIYYEVELDGKPIRPQTPQAFSLMPPPVERDGEEQPPDFSVAFSSCMFPAGVPVQPIWEQIGSYRPDALMLIGDNNYMPNHAAAYETDVDTITYALQRYHRYLRDVPGLRSLIATTPTYGIWDDHDYGPNNSDRTFKWRELTLDLFKKYYPNPTAGTADTPGIFTSLKIGDAEFFLLDDRYYRDPNNSPGRKAMFGAAQMDWLKSSLMESSATFKVVVNGGTMLVDRLGAGEQWANFGNERDDFLEWLSAKEITGVFFVVGDWHVGTMSRLHRPQDKYPLYELLTSNSAVSLPQRSSGFGQKHYRLHQFVGPEYRGFNFGLVRFGGPKGSRNVSLQIIDEHGDARVSLTLNETDLSPGWRQVNGSR